MPSSWGDSWGTSWGISWGSVLTHEHTIIQQINLNPGDKVTKKTNIINYPIIVLPDLISTKPPKKCIVVYESNNLAVVMPCPLFGDSQSQNLIVSPKRTMTGKLYTYIKTTNLNKLSYKFEINRNKSIELHNFLINYFSNLVWLTNWKGEKWLGYITNNPMNTIIKGLREPTGEYAEVQIDFEGFKVQ